MNQFFSSISNVLNQPGDESVLQSAVLQGQSLAQTINSMANQTVQLRSSIDGQISGMAPDINGLTSQIAQLNTQIATVTGGGQSPSSANGLTDQRNQAISELSQLVGIQVNAQPDGSVSIYNGGNYLVDEGTRNRSTWPIPPIAGSRSPRSQIEGTNAPLQATSGQLQGLINSRDDVLGGFQDQLNSFTATLDQRVQQDLFRRARDFGLYADDEPQRGERSQRSAQPGRPGFHTDQRFVSDHRHEHADGHQHHDRHSRPPAGPRP